MLCSLKRNAPWHACLPVGQRKTGTVPELIDSNLFPFALCLSEAKLIRRINGCSFFFNALKEKDDASTSSA
jgi:hypothetical protein